MNNEQHKKLRYVMGAVAALPPSERLSVLHAAWQLAVAKVYERHVEAMQAAGEQKEEGH